MYTLLPVRLFTLLCFLAFSFATHAQWQQVPIPLRVGFNDIVAYNGQLYGVADGLQGIYASADGGDNWIKQWEGVRLFINPFDSSFTALNGITCSTAAPTKAPTGLLSIPFPMTPAISPG